MQIRKIQGLLIAASLFFATTPQAMADCCEEKAGAKGECESAEGKKESGCCQNKVSQAQADGQSDAEEGSSSGDSSANSGSGATKSVAESSAVESKAAPQGETTKAESSDSEDSDDDAPKPAGEG